MAAVQRTCLLLVALCAASLAQTGYQSFPSVPGSSYRVYTSNETWLDALTVCNYDCVGTHLVVINSQAEADVVKEMYNLIPGKRSSWVGINDIAQEGNWVTVLGGLVSNSGYAKWNDGQPDNHKSKEHCGTVNINGNYNDMPCGTKLPFICEKPTA